MSEAFKICPICDTANHRNASSCANCGAPLVNVSAVSGSQAVSQSALSNYDYRYGETDLFENSLRPVAQRYLAVTLGAILLVMLAALVMMLAPRLTADRADAALDSTTDARNPLITNTERPTSAAPTVTVGSPTLTPSRTPSPSPTVTMTPTREPCSPQVLPDDGLISIVSRCGHRDLYVITQVIEMNNLASASDIRPGQILLVPWPTDTPDPNSTATFTPEATQVAAAVLASDNSSQPAQAGTEGTAENTLSASDFELTQAVDPFVEVTPTLPPGIMYYTVQAEDNAITISDSFNTSVEVLSQLNPEITFSQCDFGLRFGGPRCIVPLGQGQLVRVPAPTPTPSLSPTPSGSETATPTMTPTYNAPFPLSPDHLAYFRKDQFVTLRWGTTGVLAEDETYLVQIERLDDGLTFNKTTDEQFLLLPTEWQGKKAGRYEYSWTVSVVNDAAPEDLQYTTEPRSFTWEGTGEQK